MKKIGTIAVALFLVQLCLPNLDPLVRPRTGTVAALTLQGDQLPGLRAPVRVVRDGDNIPHIFAANDQDAYRVQGFLHAVDRFFQMDFQRRQASGTLGELIGQAGIPSDIQLRTLGVRRAAEESFDAYPPETRALVEAYAAGVNAYVKSSLPLPPEYAALELTRRSIPDWTPLDTMTVAKAVAFGFSAADALRDIELTPALAAYQRAGQAGNFDGTKLFFEDCFRSAPFDPTLTVPDFFQDATTNRAAAEQTIAAARNLSKIIRPETIELARQYTEKIKSDKYLRAMFDQTVSAKGSNWWVIAGKNTTTGAPMLASDPHLSLSTPSVWYEVHITVENDPDRGPMNVNGVSFAGIPGVVTGATDRVAWGLTVNPVDVADAFQEDLRVDPFFGIPQSIVVGGQEERLNVTLQSYRVNQANDTMMDNVGDATVPLESSVTVTIPRRNNGPLVALTRDPQSLTRATGISIQYTGFRVTRELDSFLIMNRAKNLDDLRRAARFFDTGSQNFSYADVEGNIAYIAPIELPLRDDLQNLGRVDGTPPFLIRDGSGRARNQWIPVQNRPPDQALNFEILPFEELPQVVNPDAGFISSANQDPVGTTLRNNVFGRTRKTGTGVYYLNVGYADGNRQGRIVRLIRQKIADGGKISVEDMQAIQGNNQMLDAEVLVPYILKALENARAMNAPASLATLANDPRIIEAVQRFAKWDFSTPTGIREGYDPGDDPANLADPSETEIQNSVAATLYAAWRGRMLANTIDGTLARLQLGTSLPPQAQALSLLRSLLDNFAAGNGRGAAGVNFFAVEGETNPEVARDRIILTSLSDALNALAGDSYADAFNKSTNQNDYRWGRLHRIVFAHPLGGPFNVPPAGGFSNVSDTLPGVARAGGYEVVDASTHAIRLRGPASATFDAGPSRRMIVEMTPTGPNGFQIIPGGQTAILGNPFYANQLGRWLTNRYHPMLFTRDQVEAAKTTEVTFTP